MLSRICRGSNLKRSFITDRKFIVRHASAIILNNNKSTLVQNDRTSNRLCTVFAINVPVRYRRFDSKNDPKDDDNPDEVGDSQNIRAVYDVKSNPDNTSIATIQVPEELPYLPLVTITKPPLYPRLFRIVEVCFYINKNINRYSFLIRLFYMAD